jgi:uncharacterized protein
MKKLFVEFADTNTKREYGLMNRKSLNHNGGMLFKFHFPTKLSFWMRDTYIPLDIAFIDDSGKILQIEEMIPLSTKPIRSSNSCRYALEVNKGWFNNNGIKVGDIVSGEYIKKLKSTKAQVAPLGLGLDIGIPQQPPQPPPNPNIQLNKSFKDILLDAEVKGKNLNIIYETKKGIVLPPKVISPPFEFVDDEDGHSDAVVKAWDNQTAGWKSFIIDNIISLEEKIEES